MQLTNHLDLFPKKGPALVRGSDRKWLQALGRNVQQSFKPQVSFLQVPSFGMNLLYVVVRNDLAYNTPNTVVTVNTDGWRRHSWGLAL